MPWNFNPAAFKKDEEPEPPAADAAASAAAAAISAAGQTTITTAQTSVIYQNRATDTRGPFFNPVGYDQNLRAGGWSPRDGSSWVGPTFAASQEAKESAMMERQMELKARRAVEDEQRKQKTAALVVRKIVQKVRQATVDDIDELKAEMEQSQIDQFDRMGPIEAEKVREEAEKALHQAQVRLEGELIQRAEDAKQKAVEEATRQEEGARLAALQTSCLEEVASVESKVSAARATAKPVTEDPNVLENADVAGMCQKADDSIQAALAALAEAQKSVAARRQDMGESEEAVRMKNSAEMKGIPAKLNAWKSALNTLKKVVKSCRDRAERQAAQQKKDEEMRQQFAQYKAAGTEEMSKEGMVSYARAEHDLLMDEEMADRVVAKLGLDGDGVPYAKFQQLRVLISTEKAALVAKEKKEEEDRKRQALEDKKEAQEAMLRPAKDALSEAESATGKLKRLLGKLAPPQAKRLSSAEMGAACDEVDAELSIIHSSLEKAEAVAKELEAAAEEGEPADLETFRKGQLASMRGRSRTCLTSARKSQEVAAEARSRIDRAIVSEMEKLRQQVAGVVCLVCDAEGKSSEQVFQAAVDEADHGGAMGFAQFLALARSFSVRCPQGSLPEALSPDVIDEEMMERLFKHVAGCGGDRAASPTLRLEGFLELLARVSYRVAKATVLTEELDIKSQACGRIEAGEVLRAVGPPRSEGSGAAGLTRIKCRSAADAEGWATITGSKGAAFLEPLGLFYYCIKEVVMTSALSVEGSKTVRYLDRGELVQALQPADTDAAIGLLRVRCRAKRDGKEGWVSIAGNQGTLFLEPC